MTNYNENAYDTDKLTYGGYLSQHGLKLIQNGYLITPIRPGKKSPTSEDWRNVRSTKSQLAEWIEGGHQHSGIGIVTRNTPGIDIDVEDEEVAEALQDWLFENVGEAPVRVGRWPRRLLLYRCDTPFRKIQSSKYAGELGDEYKVEALADGQQFVAYARHPDTGKPYEWVNEGQNPLEIAADDLPTITAEQIGQFVTYFESIADDREDWTMTRKARRFDADGFSIDEDNPFAEDSAGVDISVSDLRKRLMLVPGNDDYDLWFQIGMALYHQFDGDDEGLLLWQEWSETADNYEPESLDEKWNGGSFDIEGKGRAPLTARFILRLATESAETAAAELAQKLNDAFTLADTLEAWKQAQEKAQSARVDALSRKLLAQSARDSLAKITGKKIPIVEIRKMIAYRPKDASDIPEWCEDWAYDLSDDKFAKSGSKTAVSVQGFNALNDRNAIFDKDAIGEDGPKPASWMALNFYRVPVVYGRRYAPGKDEIFVEHGNSYVNTYTEREIPEIPKELTPRDKGNLRRVKAHIAHLLPDEREQRLFLDLISWIVQNPGQHANFALLLQGVEGDGKTFWAELLREVMGVSNVRMLNAHILESGFTDWAEGQCLVCLEEVRIINAHNKFETINRIKPFITNNIIEVHPKGRPVYDTINTSSYIMFTNFKDALPIDEDTRRYLVLFSQWQKREALRAFRRKNPDYYERLYATIVESPGAIRGWLLNHQQADDFDAKGEAPDTAARQFMVHQSKHSFMVALEDLIAEGRYVQASEELLNITDVVNLLEDYDADIPRTKAMGSMLMRAGWHPLGRVRLPPDGRRATFYARKPEKFAHYDAKSKKLEADPSLIREYLEFRENLLDEEL